jgi:integrase
MAHLNYMGDSSMGKHTRRRAPRKPEKPRADFPLFAHASGQWAKKIRGRLFYFGTWADPDAALGKYLDQKDDLHAGRTPRARRDGVTVRDLLNHFLTAKADAMGSAELAERTFSDYRDTCERVGKAFGLTRLVDDLHADDFGRLRAGMTRRWGPTTVGNEIQRVRTLFKFACDSDLIDRPVKFGPAFKRPSRKVLRRARREAGPRMFDAAEIKQMMGVAGPQLRAMILLGVNAGFGNGDVGRLPLTALDLDGGWVDFPRPKTKVQRRCPLWAETVAALREAIASRPKPARPADRGLVFVTKQGRAWYKPGTGDPVCQEFGKLVRRLDIHRPGVGFYALQHTFQTIADASRDPVVCQLLMGHAEASNDMGHVYREKIDDDRLVAVVEHVHCWLYGGAQNE